MNKAIILYYTQNKSNSNYESYEFYSTIPCKIIDTIKKDTNKLKLILINNYNNNSCYNIE